MVDLKLLVQSLDKSEKKIIRKQLSVYSSKGLTDTKSLELFDLLCKNKKVLSNIQYCKILYGDEHSNKFRALKSRLKKKILDALVSDVSLSNKDLEPGILHSILLKKKLAQFQVLHYTKGKSKITMQLLQETVTKAERLELYMPMIEALNNQKLLLGFRQGETELNRYRDRIKKAKQYYDGIIELSDLYNILIIRSQQSNPDINEIQEFLKKSIQRGNEINSEIDSPLATFLHQILQYAFYENEGNYLKAKETCLKQISLIESSPSVYRRRRLGAHYDYLSECELQLGNYQEAITNTKKAQAYFMPEEVNYIISREILFQALMYAKDTKEAKKVALELKSDYQDTEDAFRRSKYVYFYANTLFMDGKYKKVIQELATLSEIGKDAVGWEIGIRILTILAFIEQKKFDDASQRVEALLMHVYRNKRKNKLIRDRDKLIVSIIKKLNENGYDFNLLRKELALDLKKLKSKKYQWKPITAEIVRFEDWLSEKV